MQKFKHGDIIEAAESITYTRDDGKVLEIKPGEQVVIRFDDTLYAIAKNSVIVPAEGEMEITGNSADGVAEFLSGWLASSLKLDKILENTEIDIDIFYEVLRQGLVMLGMEEYKGNEEIAENDL